MASSAHRCSSEMRLCTQPLLSALASAPRRAPEPHSLQIVDEATTYYLADILDDLKYQVRLLIIICIRRAYAPVPCD